MVAGQEGDVKGSDLTGVEPVELLHVQRPVIPYEAAVTQGTENMRLAVEMLERGQVEMVVMPVGDEDRIDGGHLVWREGDGPEVPDGPEHAGQHGIDQQAGVLRV